MSNLSCAKKRGNLWDYSTGLKEMIKLKRKLKL